MPDLEKNADNYIMDFLTKILGLALTAFGGFIIVSAYIRQFHNYKVRKTGVGKHSSPAPFIGPIFVIVGLTLLSVKLSVWVWLLFLIDPDTVVIVLSLPMLIKRLSGNR